MAPFINAAATIQQERIMLKTNIFFIKKEIDVFDQDKKAKKDKPKKKDNEKKKKKISFNFIRKIFSLANKFIKQLVISFRLEKAVIYLDTDDYPLNAQLTPMIYYSSLAGIDLNINYFGKNSIELKISNKIGKILVIFLKAAFRFLIIKFTKR